MRQPHKAKTTPLNVSFHSHRVCFTKLKLLLIAIEVRSSNSNGSAGSIVINPGPEAKVEAGTQGFFIAQSDDEAKR